MSGLCLWYIGVARSFENVCEIYISDGERDGLEKTLAAYVYK